MRRIFFVSSDNQRQKMMSPVVNQQDGQLTLSFEPGLSDRHINLRACLAACIYQRGLGNVAIDLNKSPGNLSKELGDDETRHFSVDNFEKYIEKFGDTTPIYYLIDKFLNDPSRKKEAAMAQLAPMLKQLMPMMKEAGLL
jgi:hypothetical protein